MADTPFDPFTPAGSAALIVYLDIKSPYAVIAKDPTRALGQRLGIEIDWRPLTLNIPSYLGSARLDKKGKVVESKRSSGQWASVKYAYADARRYAALQRYTLRGTEKIWDTSLVHIGFMWAKQQSSEVLDRFLDEVYERFWRRDFDAENLLTVTQALQQADAAVEGFEAFAAGPGREQHDSMQSVIFDAGIFGVPSYVLEGEVYFGREHLPRVRWILEGRRGSAPDVSLGRLEGC